MWFGVPTAGILDGRGRTAWLERGSVETVIYQYFFVDLAAEQKAVLLSWKFSGCELNDWPNFLQVCHSSIKMSFKKSKSNRCIHEPSLLF